MHIHMVGRIMIEPKVYLEHDRLKLDDERAAELIESGLAIPVEAYEPYRSPGSIHRRYRGPVRADRGGHPAALQ